MYKIEDNILPPSKPDNKGITAVLKQLLIGQSFLLPIENKRAGLHAMAKQIGIKIATKREYGDEKIKIFNEKYGYDISEYPVIGTRVFRVE